MTVATAFRLTPAAAPSRSSNVGGGARAPGRFSWCWTTVSTSSRRPRAWPRRCCAPAPACASSPRAASRCARRRSTSTASRRSTFRTKRPGRGRRAALQGGHALRRARPGGGATVRARPPVAAAAAAICRHLDGIPLAIELAAARIAAFGVEGVASRLDDRFRLLTGGSRTALPRQQTLRATLDWSHELLAEPERVLLRRLAVMAGSFSLDAATSIAAGPELAEGDVVDVRGEPRRQVARRGRFGGAVTSYRLLETTRAYARERLAESGEVERFSAAPCRVSPGSLRTRRRGVARPADRRVAGHIRPGARRSPRGARLGLRLRGRCRHRCRADDRRGAALVSAVTARRVSHACRARTVDAERDWRVAMPAQSSSCRPHSAGR